MCSLTSQHWLSALVSTVLLTLDKYLANWAIAAVFCHITDILLADCRKEEDIDPEQIRKDIERLQLIKQKR